MSFRRIVVLNSFCSLFAMVCHVKNDSNNAGLIKPPIIDSFNCHGNNCVFYRVDRKLFPIKQPTEFSCWAAALTMLLSWKEGRFLNIDQTVSKFGSKYHALSLRIYEQTGSTTLTNPQLPYQRKNK
jgi:hypothetical protein